MERRKKLLACLLLLAAGVAAGVVFRPWIVRGLRAAGPLTAAQWDEQVRMDAQSLAAVLSPSAPEGAASDPQVRAKWDERRARYTPERLADLRGRLGAYLDFLVAEYADCAEIYRVGAAAPPDRRSDAAEAARAALRRAFGPFAEDLAAQADELREEAFRASPKVAGYSAELTDFRQEYDDLVARLPVLRALADDLTRPVP